MLSDAELDAFEPLPVPRGRLTTLAVFLVITFLSLCVFLFFSSSSGSYFDAGLALLLFMNGLVLASLCFLIRTPQCFICSPWLSPISAIVVGCGIGVLGLFSIEIFRVGFTPSRLIKFILLCLPVLFGLLPYAASSLEPRKAIAGVLFFLGVHTMFLIMNYAWTLHFPLGPTIYLVLKNILLYFLALTVMARYDRAEKQERAFRQAMRERDIERQKARS